VKNSLLKLLALVPIPVVIGLVLWAGTRPVPPPPLLRHGGGGHGGADDGPKAVTLPEKLKSGWAVQGKVERYNKKTLFDRIDGAAPAYIRAGFVYSLGAELKLPDMKESVVADIYAMGSAARALGMYATERDASYSFIEVGEEGYLASGSLNFWQDQFYIKLAGFEEGESMNAALRKLASDLGGALPATSGGGKKELAPLRWLPPDGRQENSDGYSHTPLGDVEGLEQVFFASYKEQGAEERYRLFVGQAKDAAEAGQRYGRVKAYFEKDGAKTAESTEGSVRILKVEGDAPTLLLQKGSTLAGAVDLPSAGLVAAAQGKLLKALETPIPQKKVKKAEAR
jgi:hypothetical protein